MGIKDLFKIFDQYSVEIKEKDMKDCKIAVDANMEIYRMILGMKNINQLTDIEGKPTQHLLALMNNIIRYSELNIVPIYVFDSSKPHPLKKLTLEKRSLIKTKAETDNNEKQAFRITEDIFNDVKKIIYLTGNKYIEAPDGYEAEKLACCIKVNAILSNDADTFLFGAKKVIKREKLKGKTILKLYRTKTILEKLNITKDELIKIGVALGSDFAEKTKGVGYKTVINKVKNDEIKFSELQEEAIEYFKAPCPEGKIVEGKKDIRTLFNWLVSEKNFNEDIWRKRIAKLN